MLEFKWVFVTWLLWNSITVNGKCPTDAELAAYAKRATKSDWAKKAKDAIALGSAVAVGAGAITTAATAGAAAVVMAPLVGGIVAIGGLITAGINIFGPKDEPAPGQPIIICDPPNPEIHEIKEFVEQINPMLHNLSNLVTEGFDTVRKDINEAVGEIMRAIGEAHQEQFHQSWVNYVIAPMNVLRDTAVDVVSTSLTNFSAALQRSAADSMATVCKDYHSKPFTIASHIWSMFGDGCKKEKTTILEGPYCDPRSPEYESPCITFENSCYAEIVIRNSGHNHSSATYLTNLVMGTILELTTYQAICSNYTYQTDAAIETSNNQFRRTVNKTLNQMQAIIINEIERYWPGPAEELLTSVIRNNTNARDAAYSAFKIFRKKFFWFRHSVLPVGKRHSSTVSSKFLSAAYDYTGGGTIKAVRYRYATDEDKKSLSKKFENHINWLDTRMTGEYSDVTVREFLKSIPAKDSDWTKNVSEVLQTFDSGYVASERMSEFVNMYNPNSSSFTHPYPTNAFDDEMGVPECNVSTTAADNEYGCLWMANAGDGKNCLILFISD